MKPGIAYESSLLLKIRYTKTYVFTFLELALLQCKTSRRRLIAPKL
jgi:hypothetical protein